MTELAPLQAELTEIWQEVFGPPQDGATGEESLFEIGGTSLQAVRLANRIEETFGVRIPLPVLYVEGSPLRLAELVEEKLLASLDDLSDEDALTLLRENGEQVSGHE